MGKSFAEANGVYNLDWNIELAKDPAMMTEEELSRLRDKAQN